MAAGVAVVATVVCCCRAGRLLLVFPLSPSPPPSLPFSHSLPFSLSLCCVLCDRDRLHASARRQAHVGENVRTACRNSHSHAVCVCVCVDVLVSAYFARQSCGVYFEDWRLPVPFHPHMSVTWLRCCAVSTHARTHAHTHTRAHTHTLCINIQEEDSEDEDPRFREVINAVHSSVSSLQRRPEVRVVCVCVCARVRFRVQD